MWPLWVTAFINHHNITDSFKSNSPQSFDLTGIRLSYSRILTVLLHFLHLESINFNFVSLIFWESKVLYSVSEPKKFNICTRMEKNEIILLYICLRWWFLWTLAVIICCWTWVIVTLYGMISQVSSLMAGGGLQHPWQPPTSIKDSIQ